MNGYSKIIEGGLVLVNATQHSQEGQPWPSLGIVFTDNNFTPWQSFSPQKDVRDQVKVAWRNVLAHLDHCHSDGIIPHGIMLGGYAPAVAGVYHWARQLRVPCWVAVMGPAPMIDGQKRGFVPVGVRQIFPQLGEAVGDWQDQQKTTFFRVGSRPFTEDRREQFSVFTPRQIVDKFEEYLLPPGNGMVPAELILYCQELAGEARKAKASLLVDGLPAETMLYLLQFAKVNRVQVYFLKTEVPQGGGIPVPVGVAPMPRW